MGGEGLEGAIYYLNLYQSAVERQARRIAATPRGADTMVDRQIDAVLFILAAYSARRAFLYLMANLNEPRKPEMQAALDAFDNACPDLVDMRNALQHFDAYLLGEGRAAKGQQQDYLWVKGNPPEFDIALRWMPMEGEQGLDRPDWEVSVAATQAAFEALSREAVALIHQ